tara:strand:- start:908 stop:1198 length:291 start_codon:yes stop_codon:yes gene_type:complete
MLSDLTRKEKMEKMVLFNQLSSVSYSLISKTGFLSEETLQKFALLWAELSATIMFDWVGDITVDEYERAKERFEREFGEPFGSNGKFNTSNFNDII